MSLMEWVFGKQITPQERLKMNQRSLQRAMRELDREKRKLEQQETKLVSEIRKMCKNGQIKQAKIKSKDLIRTKNYVKKFDVMSTKLNMINLRIQTIRSSDLMTKSLREATGLLNAMNRGINLPQLQKISMEFEKQNEMMDQKQEMMDDALDDVFEEEDEEEEADEFLNQIMDEIGVDLKNKLNTNTPEENLEQNTLQEAQNEDSNRVAIGADNDLQARLDSLKR
ncbi:hypothetical protein ACO0SA_002338 [Hanseniaspora valbyensis]|mgnify:FL=1|uniref:Snf7-domain-containing protein n=1 Tax=Hanseniaspora valbyensis NRRL Y-1626 TaxID=766949 RepID=A0A1B7TJB3_9ASCO|nr:Snf7-domain-containing protein [Hanseniaspora valbyensis NRRL Y-1626]